MKVSVQLFNSFMGPSVWRMLFLFKARVPAGLDVFGYDLW